MIKNIFILIVFILFGNHLQASLSDQEVDLAAVGAPRGPLCRGVGGLCVLRRKPCQTGYYAPEPYKGRPFCYKRRKCCAPIPPSTTTASITTTTTTAPPTTPGIPTTAPPTTPGIPTTAPPTPPEIPTTAPPTTQDKTTSAPPPTRPEKPTTAPPPTTPEKPTTGISCPDGFELIENQCFKFYNESSISWGLARVHCELAGTILAEPATTATFIKLAQYAIEHRTADWDRHPEYAHYWLGARGDGSGMVWENRNTYLASNAPWMHDQPEGISNAWCLDLRAESVPITEPLATWLCARTHNYICEYVL